MLRDLRRPQLFAERVLSRLHLFACRGDQTRQPRLWSRQAVLGKQRIHSGGVRTESFKAAVAADKEVAAGTATVR